MQMHSGLSHGDEGGLYPRMHRGRSGGGPFRQPSVSLYCLGSQVPSADLLELLGPRAPNMTRARRYVRYHRGRDMRRGMEREEQRKGEEGSHIERPRRASVVLFQVCIRFVFQPIILTRLSVSSPLSLSLSLCSLQRQGAHGSKGILVVTRKHSQGT